MERTLRDWRAILVFVGPALLLYALVVLVPILWSLGYTVYEGSPIAGFKFVGVENYVRLVQDPTFWKALWFGTKYALLVSAGQVVFGLLLLLIMYPAAFFVVWAFLWYTPVGAIIAGTFVFVFAMYHNRLINSKFCHHLTLPVLP